MRDRAIAGAILTELVRCVQMGRPTFGVWPAELPLKAPRPLRHDVTQPLGL